MAYGLNKPSLIMSGKLNGKRIIPSDIEFVRYIDFPLIEFGGWSGASQKLLDRLRENRPIIPIKKLLDLDSQETRRVIISHFMRLLHLKEKLPNLKSNNLIINQIIFIDTRLVGIIKNAKDITENLCFNFYISVNEIEQLVGRLKCYHVQPNGLAQVDLYKLEGGGDYLDNIAQYCLENGTFVPGEHRIELIIPKELEKIKIEEIRNIINSLNSII